jgi:hypothetical protein
MKLTFILFVYMIVLGLYYLIIKRYDSQSHEFSSMLFHYPRWGIVLIVAFFAVNFYSFFLNRVTQTYPIVFLWLPFLLFLVFIFFGSFYHFFSIGAPFKHNTIMNLFTAHFLAFMFIRLFIFRGTPISRKKPS